MPTSLLYGKNRYASLNQLRYDLFSQKLDLCINVQIWPGRGKQLQYVNVNLQRMLSKYTWESLGVISLLGGYRPQTPGK